MTMQRLPETLLHGRSISIIRSPILAHVGSPWGFLRLHSCAPVAFLQFFTWIQLEKRGPGLKRAQRPQMRLSSPRLVPRKQSKRARRALRTSPAGKVEPTVWYLGGPTFGGATPPSWEGAGSTTAPKVVNFHSKFDPLHHRAQYSVKFSSPGHLSPTRPGSLRAHITTNHVLQFFDPRQSHACQLITGSRAPEGRRNALVQRVKYSSHG